MAWTEIELKRMHWLGASQLCFIRLPYNFCHGNSGRQLQSESCRRSALRLEWKDDMVEVQRLFEWLEFVCCLGHLRQQQPTFPVRLGYLKTLPKAPQLYNGSRLHRPSSRFTAAYTHWGKAQLSSSPIPASYNDSHMNNEIALWWSWIKRLPIFDGILQDWWPQCSVIYTRKGMKMAIMKRGMLQHCSSPTFKDHIDIDAYRLNVTGFNMMQQLGCHGNVDVFRGWC